MNSSKLSRFQSRSKGRKGAARRRDSGYSGCGDTQLNLLTKAEPGGKEAEARDSGDSGVGSPSPSIVRAWGRKATWRQEARLLASTKAAAQRLATAHGGELLLVYRPRAHPNLPSLEPDQTRLFIPKKTWERSQPDPDVKSILPGFFLAKSGLTETDILENRLPSIPAGIQAAISNGLSLDLMRLVQREADLGPQVARFIFTFLELAFPESLVGAAVKQTLECLEENMSYVLGCGQREAATFLYAPFEVPRDVMEMAAVQEYWDTEENDDGQVEGGDSSLSFGELSVPELEAANSQAEDGLSEDVLSNPSLELGGEEMLPADALVLPCSFSLEEEEEVVDRLAFLEEGQESLLLTDSSLDAQSLEYLAEPVYNTEDENFSYTATVLNLDQASLSRLMGPAMGASLAEGWLENSDQSPTVVPLLPGGDGLSLVQPTSAADSEGNNGHPSSSEDSQTPSKKSERSRTRTVQVPSRFKDFSTAPFMSKKAKLESS